MVDVLTRSLAETDPQIHAAVQQELLRQQGTLEMIASENFAPTAVMEAQGSVLTNKYAEGYPGKRYYGGCEHVDVVEQLAIDRLKSLFGSEFANVQPHSGAQANAAAMFALIQPGDTILGLNLAHGGHLTHGMRINFSGKLYKVVPYGVAEDTMRIDMAEVERLAVENKPKLIVAGWSAYSRQLDFAEFRRIADLVGAYLMVDMAHFAGLVAAGLHPNPVPHAHIVTSTTHKTLGGPRGGVILTNDADIAKKVNSAVFPGQQGGPLEHVIAAKAVAFKLAAEPAFRDRQERTLEGARIIAERMLSATLQSPASPLSAAAPTCTWSWLISGTPSWTGSRAKTGCTGSASRSTATRCPSTRVRLWSLPVFVSARRHWPRVASGRQNSPRLRTLSLQHSSAISATRPWRNSGSGLKSWPESSPSTPTSPLTRPRWHDGRTASGAPGLPLAQPGSQEEL